MTQEVDVQSLCNERIYHTSATFQCTCCTYSYKEKCACLLLACELFDVILARDVPTLSQEDTLMQLNGNTAANHSKTEVQMLNEMLETVQKLQNIPQHISQQIENLHDSVTNASMTGTAFIAVTTDLKRKIRPLFPHRAKNMKRKYRKNFKRRLTKF